MSKTQIIFQQEASGISQGDYILLQNETTGEYKRFEAAKIVVPELPSKSITANGTYTAEDDGKIGWSEVVVNVPPVANDYVDITGGADTISLSKATGVTRLFSNVVDRCGTLICSEVSAEYEGFNIRLLNLEIGKTYKVNFDFAFYIANFFGGYKAGYDIFATNRDDYYDYSSAWNNNLTRDNSRHNYQKTFEATALQMFLSFNLCALEDYGTNYFVLDNLYVEEVTS